MNYKRIIYRILFLFLILIISNEAYKYFFYQEDLKLYAPVLHEMNNINDETQVLYLGSSSNLVSYKEDRDKRPISQMISDADSALKLEDISIHDVTPSLYLSMLKNMDPNSSIDIIVIEMSLRSFGSNVYISNRANEFNRSKIFLSGYPPLMKRILLNYKYLYQGHEIQRMQKVRKAWKEEIPNKDGKLSYANAFEWDRAMAIKGVRHETGEYDQQRTAMACQYIKSFAFKISDDHPVLKDYDRLISYANNKGWKVIINFLPENIEEAQILAGTELSELMKLNRDLLLDQYAEKNVEFIDNLEAVKDKDFIDRQWNTERYKEKGRIDIANNIVAGLSKLMNKPGND